MQIWYLITKRPKLIVYSAVAILILARLAYGWASAVDKKPINKLEKNSIDLVEINHRYKPIKIDLDPNDPKLANLIKLTKKWWYFERFSIKSMIYNHVADYTIYYYLDNERIEIPVFPKSDLFSYIEELVPKN